MSKKHKPGFIKLVEAAKQRIVEVTVPEVLERRKVGDCDFVLVDVREESEWSAGRIAMLSQLDFFHSPNELRSAFDLDV